MELEKLTLEDCEQIAYTLKNILLPAKTEGLAYAIAKNIAKLDRCLKKKYEEIAILNEKYYFKDDNQNVIMYAYIPHEKNPYKFDENGNYIIVPSEQRKSTPAAPRTDLNNPDYKSEMKKLKSDIDIKLHKFDAATVKKNYEAGHLDHLDISCLFGVLIDIEE